VFQLERLLKASQSAAQLKRYDLFVQFILCVIRSILLCRAQCVVSTVSHELRTPMTGITSVVELMDKTPLDADQRDMLGIMKSSVQIMLRLINDILLFSKVF
jgi:K+-sensing histidine kinase KdpD